MLKITSFIPFLRVFLMPLLGMAFAAGGSMLDGFGGSDAGVISGGDTRDDGAGAVDGADEGGGIDGAGSDDDAGADDTAVVASSKELDGLAASTQGKKAVQDLKTTNPEAYKVVKSLLFSQNELKKVAPGGVREVRQMKQALEQMGDPEEISELRTTAENLQAWQNELDEGFKNGDPQYLESIIENSPDGFKKMMPTALSRYAQLDPAGFQHQMARIIGATFQAKNVPSNLTFLRSNLAGIYGNLKRAYESMADKAATDPTIATIQAWFTPAFNSFTDTEKYLKSLEAVVKDIDDTAKTAPAEDAKVADDPRKAQEAQQNQERVAKQTLTGERLEMFETNLIEREMTKYLNGRTADPELDTAVLARARKDIRAGIGQDKKLRDKLNRLEASGKFDELLKELKTETQKRLSAVKHAHGIFYRAVGLGGKSKPGDKPAAGAKPGQQPQSKPQTSFQMLPKQPSRDQIDIDKTTALAQKNGLTYARLIMKNRAVLKGGRQVQWK